MLEVSKVHAFNTVVMVYEELYRERYGQDPLKLADQDRAILRGMVDKHGLDLTAKLLRQYFSMAGLDDDWFEKNGHSVKTFQEKLLPLHSVLSKQEKRQRENAGCKIRSDEEGFLHYLLEHSPVAARYGFTIKPSVNGVETTTEPVVTLTYQELRGYLEEGDLSYPGLIREILTYAVAVKRGELVSFDKQAARQRIQEKCDKAFLSNAGAIGRVV